MSTIENVFNTQAIRKIEQCAIQQFKLSSQMLMQQAGQAAFDVLLNLWPNVTRIAVFCGSGNNGGDGYILASLAAQHGIQVNIWQFGDGPSSQESKEALEVCQRAQIPISASSEMKLDHHPDVIIDAICGMGVNTLLRPELIRLVQSINQLNRPVLSIDVPTGVHADTGEILGAAIQAHATITFIGLKLGLLTGAGVGCTGRLICHTLNLPSDCFSGVASCARTLYFSKPFFPIRKRDWHKGLSGSVLIIGGGIGYPGAPQLAAMAALRIGVGCVTIATNIQYAASLAPYPEIMLRGVQTFSDLAPLLNKADAIVVGPGLTHSSWAKELWQPICDQPHPKVFDADALNLLADMPVQKNDWILTPHPGEASRLLHQPLNEIQNNRLRTAQAIQAKYGGTCVLKGAGTLVLDQLGMPLVCLRGNAGMATAGMGDLLSGIIGGLIAGGMPPSDAAGLGVYLHAMAGDLAAEDGQRGLIATDLLPYLRRLCN